MDGYSVTEAASVLGVPTERVWELLARGVLSGTPDGETGMRVFLQPRPAPQAVDEPLRSNGHGGERQADVEASPFRELLTEFRGLTERYGQALLALGEARGEVASLRSRVDVLEARMDLRLPFASPASPQPTWGGSARPSSEPARRSPDHTDDEAEVEHEGERSTRRKRGRAHFSDEFADALARAEDPSPAVLRDAAEARAAIAAIPHDRDQAAAAETDAADAGLPRELPPAETMSDFEPEASVASGPEPAAVVAPEVRPAVEVEAEAEPAPSSPSQPELEVSPPVVADVVPEPEPQPVAEAAPEFIGEAEPAAQEEPEPAAGADADAELAPEAAAVPEPEPEAVALAEPEPEPDPEPVLEATPEFVAEAEPEAQPPPEAELVVEPMPEDEPPAELDREPEAEPEPEPTPLAPEPGPEPEPQPAQTTDPGANNPAAGGEQTSPESGWDQERYSAQIEEPDWWTPEETVWAEAETPPEPASASDDDPQSDDSEAEAGGEPQTDAAPENEAPESEAPKSEAPKSEAPKSEAPKSEAPKSEAPENEAPESEAPPPVETAKAEPSSEPFRGEETMLWFGRRPDQTAAAAWPSEDAAGEMEVASTGRRGWVSPEDGPSWLPGGEELDDALAGFGSGSGLPAPTAAEHTDPLPGTTEPAAGQSSMVPATPEPVRTETGELRGPASRAYRRLRRIFPG
ncbi:MAG TPA: hypothetical protein VEW95_10880 [Candidatus Limnocylindrales bacterium]|nr:hypothetical protein [Candidatus Limnocylindrales bacterium]